MKWLPRFLSFLLALAGTVADARAQTNASINITSSTGDADYSITTGIGIFTNVVATYGDATLTADSALFNSATGDIQAATPVVAGAAPRPAGRRAS